MWKRKITGAMLIGVILMTGCSAIQNEQSVVTNNKTIDGEETTEESSVNTIQGYNADVSVLLSVSGEMDKTTVDVDMSYESHIEADLGKNLFRVTENASMNMSGDNLAIESDSYYMDSYIEKTDNGWTRYFRKSADRTENAGAWTMENVMLEEPNGSQYEAFAAYDVLEKLTATDENNSTFSGEVAYDDIKYLLDYLHAYSIDGGLLSEEIASQFDGIRIEYSLEDETTPKSITLDFTECYNKATASDDTNKVKQYVVTIDFSYPSVVDVEKPDMTEITKTYNPEEDNLTLLDDSVE